MTRAFLVLSTVAAVGAAQSADPLEGHRGIRNYYRVRPDVATAGQPSDEALLDVRKAGFKAVLDLGTQRRTSADASPRDSVEVNLSLNTSYS